MVELDLRTFYLNDLTFTGSTVLAPHVFTDVVGYIERGEVQPILAATYPLSKIGEAQAAFVETTQTGNVVLIP
jgi:NADPH:quinone reductase-like Zn-dependent oxidoreductase